MEIKLKKLSDVIVSCWDRAEAATRQSIVTKFPQPSEENLTFLFSGELRFAVGEASEAGKFESAFLADLRLCFPFIKTQPDRMFAGLRARVNFHNRSHEGRRSAADLGIVITRPFVRRIGDGQIQISRESSRALLAQAKMGRCRSKPKGQLSWGCLTNAQKKLIPEHQQYYALLLYRMSAAQGLAPFAWQTCHNSTVHAIQQWLRDGVFPSEIPTEKIIEGLSVGTLGTTSRTVVDQLIDPSSSRTDAIEIRVFWPDDKGPSDGPMFLTGSNKGTVRNAPIQMIRA
jgi:hypothetical protein